LWEGGIRVPAIIRWPGQIPANTVSGQVAITMDLTASILAATRTPIPPEAGLEGVNIFPVLTRHTPAIDRTFFSRGGSLTAGPPAGRQQTGVRSGDWKPLIDNGRPFLFNLRTDLGDRTNLIRSRSELARQLKAKLDKWQKGVDAEAKARHS